MKPVTGTIGTILVDGQPIEFVAGDTIGSSLMRVGRLGLRLTRSGAPRGVFCGIGICNDCLVSVGGRPNQRACQVPAVPGLIVETGAA